MQALLSLLWPGNRSFMTNQIVYSVSGSTFRSGIPDTDDLATYKSVQDGLWLAVLCFLSWELPIYSYGFLVTLKVLIVGLFQNHRLLVLATSSNRSFLRELELMNAFGTWHVEAAFQALYSEFRLSFTSNSWTISGHVIDVPVLSTAEHIMHVLVESDVFTPKELEKLTSDLQSLLLKQQWLVTFSGTSN